MSHRILHVLQFVATSSLNVQIPTSDNKKDEERNKVMSK